MGPLSLPWVLCITTVIPAKAGIQRGGHGAKAGAEIPFSRHIFHRTPCLRPIILYRYTISSVKSTRADSHRLHRRRIGNHRETLSKATDK